MSGRRIRLDAVFNFTRGQRDEKLPENGEKRIKKKTCRIVDTIVTNNAIVLSRGSGCITTILDVRNTDRIRWLSRFSYPRSK